MQTGRFSFVLSIVMKMIHQRYGWQQDPSLLNSFDLRSRPWLRTWTTSSIIRIWSRTRPFINRTRAGFTIFFGCRTVASRWSGARPRPRQRTLTVPVLVLSNASRAFSIVILPVHRTRGMFWHAAFRFSGAVTWPGPGLWPGSGRPERERERIYLPLQL